MPFSSSLLENAVNEFAKLPGIGKKTALRLVLHLIKEPQEDVSFFADTINRMRKEINFCSTWMKAHSSTMDCIMCWEGLFHRSMVLAPIS